MCRYALPLIIESNGSIAKVLENALIPPFEALYAAVQACEPRAAVDETFTIEPFDSIIKGRAYLHIHQRLEPLAGALVGTG